MLKRWDWIFFLFDATGCNLMQFFSRRYKCAFRWWLPLVGKFPGGSFFRYCLKLGRVFPVRSFFRRAWAHAPKRCVTVLVVSQKGTKRHIPKKSLLECLMTVGVRRAGKLVCLFARSAGSAVSRCMSLYPCSMVVILTAFCWTGGVASGEAEVSESNENLKSVRQMRLSA